MAEVVTEVGTGVGAEEETGAAAWVALAEAAAAAALEVTTAVEFLLGMGEAFGASPSQNSVLIH